MQYLTENYQDILRIATAVIAAASGVAMLTPNKTDNRVLGAIRNLVDLLALNFGNAKNEKKK